MIRLGVIWRDGDFIANRERMEEEDTKSRKRERRREEEKATEEGGDEISRVFFWQRRPL